MERYSRSDDGQMTEFLDRPELVRKRARTNMAQRLLGAAALLLGVLMILFILWDIEDGRKRGEVLLDCTTPGGECFEAGQTRTARAVQNIIDESLLQEAATRRVVVLAAYCAAQPGVETVEQIERCIEDGMREDVRP